MICQNHPDRGTTCQNHTQYISTLSFSSIDLRKVDTNFVKLIATTIEQRELLNSNQEFRRCIQVSNILSPSSNIYRPDFAPSLMFREERERERERLYLLTNLPALK